MRIRCFDIDYDTDGEDVDLPQEIIIDLDDDEDPEYDSADAISDITGWCINHHRWEPMEA